MCLHVFHECIYVYLVCACYLQSQRKVSESLELELYMVWVPMWIWELNPSPLKEQQMLLSTEPFLQTKILFLDIILCSQWKYSMYLPVPALKSNSFNTEHIPIIIVYLIWDRKSTQLQWHQALMSHQYSHGFLESSPWSWYLFLPVPVRRKGRCRLNVQRWPLTNAYEFCAVLQSTYLPHWPVPPEC